MLGILTVQSDATIKAFCTNNPKATLTDTHRQEYTPASAVVSGDE